MHTLSLGCSTFGESFGPVSNSECHNIVAHALSQGITMFDTAPWYDNGDESSEQRLGQCLYDLKDKYPREMYQICTKIGRYQIKDKNSSAAQWPSRMWDYSRETTLISVKTSLARLKMAYIDVIHIHDVEFSNINQLFEETLPALVELQQQGLVKMIGISGYSLSILHDILLRVEKQNSVASSDRDVINIGRVLTYSRLTLHDISLVEHGRIGEALLTTAERVGATVVNAAPLAMGLLTQNGPPVWHPANHTSLVNKANEAKKLCAEGASSSLQRVALFYACYRTLYGHDPDPHESLISTTISTYQKDKSAALIPTVLVSVSSLQELEENLFVASLVTKSSNISCAEYQLVISLLKTIFRKQRSQEGITSSHWEGIELALQPRIQPKKTSKEPLPGQGHIHGNFHDYYSFHPATERLRLLPTNAFTAMWQSQGSPSIFNILDIGCNEGQISIYMYLLARTQIPSHVSLRVYGIDIDPQLIIEAQVRAVNLKPQLDLYPNDMLIFKVLDITSTKYTGIVDISMIDDANTSGNGSNLQSNDLNLDALRTDIFHIDNDHISQTVTNLEQIHTFSLVCLFSVTMWLHLNKGDKALIAILQLSAGLVTNTTTYCNSGSVLVEPQPWKAYKNALKRTKRLNLPPPKYLEYLQLRDPDHDIDAILNSVTINRPINHDKYSSHITNATNEVEYDNESKDKDKISYLFQSCWSCGRESWGRALTVYHGNNGGILESCAGAIYMDLTTRVKTEVRFVVNHDTRHSNKSQKKRERRESHQIDIDKSNTEVQSQRIKLSNDGRVEESY